MWRVEPMSLLFWRPMTKKEMEIDSKELNELHQALANGGLFVNRSLFVLSPFHLSSGLDMSKVHQARNVWIAPFDGFLVFHQSLLPNHFFFAVSETESSRAIKLPVWISARMKRVGPESTEFDLEISGLRIDDPKAMIHPTTVKNRTLASLVSGGFVQLHTVGTWISHRLLWDSFVGGHRVFKWAHWQSSKAPKVPFFSD